MTPLTLYSRPDCHLCDDAAALVLAIAPNAELEVVDVEAVPELEDRYGLRVPVLRRSDRGAELCWPFDAAAVLGFLQPD